MILYFATIIIGCVVFFIVYNNPIFRYIVYIIILCLFLFIIYRKKDEILTIVKGEKN